MGQVVSSTSAAMPVENNNNGTNEVFICENLILKRRARLASAVVQRRGDAREPQQLAAVMGPHP